MSRFILRGCPHCGGDLYVNYHDSNQDGWLCLQCGRHPDRRANLRSGAGQGKAGAPGRNDRIRKSLL